MLRAVILISRGDLHLSWPPIYIKALLVSPEKLYFNYMMHDCHVMQVMEGSWTLRASALAATAEVVSSVRQGVIPLLPRLVPAVLSAAAAACDQLPHAAGVSSADQDTSISGNV